MVRIVILNKPGQAEELLLRNLRTGLAGFELGGQLGDGGRIGARVALMSLLDYVCAKNPDLSTSKLLGPLQVLLGALNDLQFGNTHPMLKARKKTGRPSASNDVMALKVHAAALITILMERNNTLPEAISKTTRHLTPLCKSLAIKLSGNTVRNWRTEILARVPNKINISATGALDIPDNVRGHERLYLSLVAFARTRNETESQLVQMLLHTFGTSLAHVVTKQN